MHPSKMTRDLTNVRRPLISMTGLNLELILKPATKRNETSKGWIECTLAAEAFLRSVCSPRLVGGDVMAKKDTYLALLRRGIDDTTANQLADAGLKIGDLKRSTRKCSLKITGSRKKSHVVSLTSSPLGPQSHGKERFLSKVLAPEKKQESRIEEIKFKRKQKDVLD